MRKEFIDEFSEILIQQGVIKKEDLLGIHRAYKSGEVIRFEDFLLKENIAERSDILRSLSIYYDLPAIDVLGEFFDHHNLRLIPKSVMLKYIFIPYTRDNDNLIVIASEPNNIRLSVVIGQCVSHNILFAVGIASDIIDAVEEYYDESITYQPDGLISQRMERSQQEVHSWGQEIIQEGHNTEIPEIIEDTIDDYESR